MDCVIIFTLICMGFAGVIGAIVGGMYERKVLFSDNVFAGDLIFAEDFDGLHMMAELDLEPEEIHKHEVVYFLVRKTNTQSYGNNVNEV